MQSNKPQAADFRAPSWVRAGFAIADQLSPALSGRWAQQLFFTPRKGPLRPADRAWLERALRFDVSTKHGRVAAYAWGDRGETVLFAHGWASRAGQFSTLMAALHAAGLRVVALDMPGHGASEGELSSVVHFADAISALASVVGKPHAIVAHSMGAAATTLALARQQLSAERLVFVAPPAEFEPYWARFRSTVGLSQNGWNAMQVAAEAWLGLSFADVIPMGHASHMTVPLLVLHDTNDQDVAICEGRKLARAWPGAQFVETHGLGHNRILRDPAVIARAIAFIRS